MARFEHFLAKMAQSLINDVIKLCRFSIIIFLKHYNSNTEYSTENSICIQLYFLCELARVAEILFS